MLLFEIRFKIDNFLIKCRRLFVLRMLTRLYWERLSKLFQTIGKIVISSIINKNEQINFYDEGFLLKWPNWLVLFFWSGFHILIHFFKMLIGLVKTIKISDKFYYSTRTKYVDDIILFLQNSHPGTRLILIQEGLNLKHFGLKVHFLHKKLLQNVFFKDWAISSPREFFEKNFWFGESCLTVEKKLLNLENLEKIV